jgi:hypothetical protein
MNTQCDISGRWFELWDGHGFLGTLDDSEDCSPFTPIIALCPKCYEGQE